MNQDASVEIAMSSIYWVKLRLLLPFFMPIALMAIAILIRCLGLGRLSFWTDEIHSLYMTQFGLLEYWAYPLLSDHPPLYFLLLRSWLLLGGDSETWVRLLSALLGGLTVLPLYALAHRIAGTQFALYASLFFVLNPLHLRYSQEARPYALLLLLVVALLWVVVRAVNQPNMLNKWLYIGFSVLLVSTHAVGGVYVMAAALLLFCAGLKSEFGARRWMEWHGYLFVLSLPLFFWLALQSAWKMGAGFWMAPPGWTEIAAVSQTTLYTEMPSINYLLHRFVGLNLPYIPLENYVWLLFLALMGCGALFAVQRKNCWFLLLIGYGLGVLLALIGISWALTPVFADRTAIGCLFIVPLLLGFPLSQCRLDAKGSAIALLTGVCLLLSAASVYREWITAQKEEWRPLIEHIAAHEEPGDGVLYWPYLSGLGVEHYANRFGVQAPVRGVPQSYEEALWTPTIHFDEAGHRGAAAAFLAEKRRVWVVQLRGPHQPEPLADLLRQSGWRVQWEARYISLDLLLFERDWLAAGCYLRPLPAFTR